MLREESNLAQQQLNQGLIADPDQIKTEEDLNLSNISMSMESDASEGKDDGQPDDNKIDKAFKRFQRKKDKLQRFRKKLKERIQRKQKEAEETTKSNNPSPVASPHTSIGY